MKKSAYIICLSTALLAFSMLMLRDLSEADLTELLTKFATDIEEDGTWDDEATKAKIADWAQAKDLAGGLATIRSYINKWDLGTVPNFEKFVRNFWYTNYGLGACATNNKDEVLDEMADVYIMLEQMKNVFPFGENILNDRINYKLNRQMDRINEE